MSKNKTPITIYSSESQIKNPLVLFKQMFFDLLASRGLAWQIFLRDIKSQYRQSVLGILWAFIPTIVTAIGFTLAKDVGVLNIPETDIPYPLYVTISTALWQAFLQSINAPIQAIQSGKGMITKVKFPHESLILAKLAELLFNFGIQVILVIVLFVWFRIQPPLSIILFPVPFLHMVLLGLTIGLFLTPVNALYNDVSRLLSFGTRILWFITPVVYPIPQTGIFQYVVKLNPVTPLLVTTRELATTGQLSQVEDFWLVSFITFILFIVGWVFFRLAMPSVVERFSS